MTVLLEIKGLSKHFPVRTGLMQREAGVVRAVDEVDLELHQGETYALVGESGSGKTTLGRSIIRLIEPTAGSIRYQSQELTELRPGELRRRRRHFQMIFQDPFGSLNPKMRVEQILAEPLAVHRIVEKKERKAEVERLLDLVGLDSTASRRFPHQFSGGQRQRIGIARALATRPDLIIADEPVSSLDVSVQAQIINLLTDLKQKLGLTLLFIAHDLALVEQIADRVGVLYLGRLVEEAATQDLFASPQHPYTVSLLSAVPIPDPKSGRRRILLPGEPPSPMDPPPGCAFHPRCPVVQPECSDDRPMLEEISESHRAACFFPGKLDIDGTF